MEVVLLILVKPAVVLMSGQVSVGKRLAVAEARFYMYTLNACSATRIGWQKI